MPIITKTASSENYSQEDVISNFATAVASAVAADVNKTADDIYYVLMNSIGYPGWCFFIHASYGKSGCTAGIVTINESGEPNIEDPNRMAFLITFANGFMSMHKNVTCTMICDNSKDTVLFSLHPGSTTHGTDINASEDMASFTFFLAKDVNENVVCGFGRLFPNQIRTLSKAVHISGKVPQRMADVSNAYHLTKMVNYLSPGCPEMKSAYVSVVRPYKNSSDGKIFVDLCNLNGADYGRASFIDSWDATNISDYKCYYPYDPFVKY